MQLRTTQMYYFGSPWSRVSLGSSESSAQGLVKLKSRWRLGSHLCGAQVLFQAHIGRVQFLVVVGLTPRFSALGAALSLHTSCPIALSTNMAACFPKANRRASLAAANLSHFLSLPRIHTDCKGSCFRSCPLTLKSGTLGAMFNSAHPTSPER